MTQPIVLRGIIMMSLLFSFFASTLGSDTDPSCECSNLFEELFGELSTKCTTETFDGLDGHPIIQLLYDVMMQSTLPNETIYTNDSHITCLFKDSKFVLGGVGPLDLNWNSQGTICVYPKDVPDGLTLGQAKDLTHSLLSPPCNCGTCGAITANYIAQNITQDGSLVVNWLDNAVCEKSDNCIDPSKDLQSSSNGTNGTDDKASAASHRFGGILGAPQSPGVLPYPLVMSFVAACVAALG
ncbi:hypothetical protein CIB48_g2550 [Xylaria polymorpha]|nr:hypothetical protein CIB48_g2550 [Xylaria polymorpha]